MQLLCCQKLRVRTALEKLSWESKDPRQQIGSRGTRSTEWNTFLKKTPALKETIFYQDYVAAKVSFLSPVLTNVSVDGKDNMES